MNREGGFTVVEVIIAIIVLTVGLLGLVSTAALVTRMIARGQSSAVAATYGAQRMEQLRTTACASQAGGSDDMYRGSVHVASTSWRFVDAGDSTYRVVVTTRYLTTQNRWRTDSVETAVSCLR